MHFHRNLEFSSRSAKMKRSMSFSDMFVCCAAFCAFTIVCDCVCLRLCHIVLLSCFLFFVVLHVSLNSGITLLPVLCLIRASLNPFVSFAPSGFNLSCLVLFLSISRHVDEAGCVARGLGPCGLALRPGARSWGCGSSGRGAREIVGAVAPWALGSSGRGAVGS